MSPDAEVVLDLEHRRGAYLLVLANTGAATAFEPRVVFDAALRGLGDEVDLAALPLWSGLAMLRPGVQVEVLLEPAGAAHAQPSIAGTVTWADAAGARHERSFAHDLSTYDGLPTPLG